MLSFFACAFLVSLTSAAAPAGYTLRWQDDFNGTSLNTSAWNVYVGTHGDEELQYYTANRVSVSNGNLVLTTAKEVSNGHNYTSGEVTSQGKVSYYLGYWEVRAKLPFGNGLWPAHWLMPNDNSCWPDHGEVDIMENLGKDMLTVYGTYHWSNQYPSKNCTNQNSQCGQSVKASADLSKDYHLYGAEWTSTEILFYFDDKAYGGGCKSGNATLPPNPMYWILNTALGGSWAGPPDSSTVFPQYHYIDYVRVYQK